MSLTKQVAVHLIPLAFVIVMIHFFWRYNYFLAVSFCLIILSLILSGKDRKKELYIAATGFIWGVFIEITGVNLSGYHTFTQPDFMGIPLWAAVGWGIGFLIAKRVIWVFTRGSPFTNNQ